MRKAYEQEIDAVLTAFEKSYQELLDNERSLKGLMEQQKKEAIELSKIEVEYKPLQRAVRARRRRCTASSPAGRRRSTSPGR